MTLGWMGRMAAIGLGILVVQAAAAEGPSPAEEPVLKTRKQKVSYAMAVSLARTAQRQGVAIDVGVFTQGLYDALEGGKLLMTQDEVKATLGGLQSDLKKRHGRLEARKQRGGAAR